MLDTHLDTLATSTDEDQLGRALAALKAWVPANALTTHGAAGVARLAAAAEALYSRPDVMQAVAELSVSPQPILPELVATLAAAAPELPQSAGLACLSAAQAALKAQIVQAATRALCDSLQRATDPEKLAMHGSALGGAIAAHARILQGVHQCVAERGAVAAQAAAVAVFCGAAWAAPALHAVSSLAVAVHSSAAQDSTQRALVAACGQACQGVPVILGALLQVQIPDIDKVPQAALHLGAADVPGSLAPSAHFSLLRAQPERFMRAFHQRAAKVLPLLHAMWQALQECSAYLFASPNEARPLARALIPVVGWTFALCTVGWEGDRAHETCATAASVCEHVLACNCALAQSGAAGAALAVDDLTEAYEAAGALSWLALAALAQCPVKLPAMELASGPAAQVLASCATSAAQVTAALKDGARAGDMTKTARKAAASAQLHFQQAVAVQLSALAVLSAGSSPASAWPGARQAIADAGIALPQLQALVFCAMGVAVCVDQSHWLAPAVEQLHTAVQPGLARGFAQIDRYSQPLSSGLGVAVRLVMQTCSAVPALQRPALSCIGALLSSSLQMIWHTLLHAGVVMAEPTLTVRGAFGVQLAAEGHASHCGHAEASLHVAEALGAGLSMWPRTPALAGDVVKILCAAVVGALRSYSGLQPLSDEGQPKLLGALGTTVVARLTRAAGAMDMTPQSVRASCLADLRSAVTDAEAALRALYGGELGEEDGELVADMKAAIEASWLHA